jgi:hypothetical protein
MNEDLAALLDSASEEPLILQTERTGDFALLRLDDEVIDLLLERNPALIEECSKIRERMKQGASVTHAQMLQMLQETPEE